MADQKSNKDESKVVSQGLVILFFGVLVVVLTAGLIAWVLYSRLAG